MKENEMQNNSRAYGLDILKAICAFGVVVLHADMPGAIGPFIKMICRIAVPIFFMITGYFYSNVEKRNYEKKQIKKIFYLCIISSTIYSVIKAILVILQKHSVNTILVELFGVKAIKNLLLFNEPPVGFHLWYLYALLYTLIIVYCLRKLLPQYTEKILYFISPILLIVDLIFGSYSLLLLHKEIPYIYVRNYLCVGIPFFSIGLFLYKHPQMISAIRKKKIFLIFSIVLFASTSMVEGGTLRFLELQPAREQYISTTLLSVSIFIIFTGHYFDGKFPILNRIGQKYSLGIYLFHPLLFQIARMTIGHMPKLFGTIYMFFNSIIIYVSTIIIIYLFKKNKRYIF